MNTPLLRDSQEISKGMVAWLWSIEDSFFLNGFHAHIVFQTLFSISMLMTSAVENPMQTNAETSIFFSITRVDCLGLAKPLNIC